MYEGAPYAYVYVYEDEAAAYAYLLTNNKPPTQSSDLHPSTNHTRLLTQSGYQHTRLLTAPPVSLANVGFLAFLLPWLKKLGGLGGFPPAAGGITCPSNLDPPTSPRVSPSGSSGSTSFQFQFSFCFLTFLCSVGFV